MIKKAVIDLGTNTFHLLIVKMDAGNTTFEIIQRKRIFVNLAEEGISKIGADACARALEAMKKYKAILDEERIETVKAFGTAALRTAENGAALCRSILEHTGIEVHLIDGLEEAQFIYNGVRRAVPFGEENQLIMDIGGGSVEFIIANHDRVFWANSFLVGVGILFNRFHKTDPISAEEIKTVEAFLEKELSSLLQGIKIHPCPTLTGASGAFETVVDMVPHRQITENFAELDLNGFGGFYKKIITSTLQERLSMPDLPDERIQMIVVAAILIDFILKKCGIERVYISSFALKEGILFS